MVFRENFVSQIVEDTGELAEEQFGFLIRQLLFSKWFFLLDFNEVFSFGPSIIAKFDISVPVTEGAPTTRMFLATTPML